MAIGDIHLCFTWQAWHLVTSTFVSRGRCSTCGTSVSRLLRLLLRRPSVTHSFVTHHLSHPALSHTIFHIHLCHTSFFRANFVTPNFVTPNFVTPNFVTHHLSHTHTHAQLCHTLSHAIFHIKFCHTQLFTYNLFYFSVLLHLLCLSFLPRPATTFVPHYRKKLTCGVIRPFNIYLYICIYMIYYIYIYI